MLIAGAIDFVVFVERAQRLPARRPAAAASSSQRPRGQRRRRPGAVQRGLRPGAGRPAPCRTRRSPASTTWPRIGYRPGRLRAVGRDDGLRPDLLLALLARRASLGGGVAAARRVADRGWPPSPARDGRAAGARRASSRGSARRRLARRSAPALVVLLRHPAGPSPRSAPALLGLRLATSSFGGAARGARGDAPRLEALAAWTESLRDTIAGAVGLEQAIPALAAPRRPRSGRTLDAAGRPAAHPRCRCRTRCSSSPTTSTTRRADLIVAALILNARLRGPGLRDVLSALAESAREELDMRRGSRPAAPRPGAACRSSSASRSVRPRAAPSSTATTSSRTTPFGGQVVLAVVCAVSPPGSLWLRRLAGTTARAVPRQPARAAGHRTGVPS